MKLFSFKGRAKRSEYILQTIVAPFVLAVMLVFTFSYEYTPILFVPMSMILFLHEISITVRRLHDLGRPGSHFWFLMIPLVNMYFAFILVFKRGVEGPNEYDGETIVKPVVQVEYVCSECGADTVLGQRQCIKCGEVFD